ncbi:MAG: aminotransferase class V-fold PLP-dependent enzyme [Gemmatimonadetes bacterium]|nr:aminotransferase class V-fold PLP-dependent enzyme [Gemmatimonadota bacterium]
MTSPHLDLDALRADTPGCAERIHLNNAGAGLMPAPVSRAIHEHLELEARMGGYEAADERHDAILAAYTAVAALTGAHAHNIAFVENATVAFAQALSAFQFERGDVILTTRADYVSNQIMYLSLAERFGIHVERAPDAAEGGVDVQAMRELIHRRRPKLVAVTHVPTNSGLVQPIEDIGRECRAREIPFLVDACQSIGQLPIDVAAIDCDFLSATARKFLRGPRGSGFLYVSDAALARGMQPLFIDMRGADWIEADLYQPAPDARRFENWEFAYALVLGTGAAARYALGVGIDGISGRTCGLAARLRDTLAAIDGVRVLDHGRRLSGIVTVHVAGWEPGGLVAELRRRRINTNASYRQYAVLDFDAKGVDWALRVSPHYYNTDAELDAFVEAIRELAG